MSAICAVLTLDIARSQGYMLFSLLLSLVVSALLVRRLFPLSGVSLQVDSPHHVMAGERAEFQIVLRNRGDRDQHSIRVDRPFLPWDGKWLGERCEIAMLPKGEQRSVSVSARFLERGPHQLDAFSAAALVPLRLTVGLRIMSDGVHFLVVPRIARVRGLSLPQGVGQKNGVDQVLRLGESQELAGVRPYCPGDRVRDLHAKTWARSGVPAVLQYQEEYFSRVGVVLDVGLRGDNQGLDEEIMEAAISLAAGVVAHLSGSAIQVDFLFSTDCEGPRVFSSSTDTVERALNQLAMVKNRNKFDGRDLVEVLNPHLDRVSGLVLVLPGWDEARGSFVDSLRAQGVFCRVLLVVRDPEQLRAKTSADACILSLDQLEEAVSGGREISL